MKQISRQAFLLVALAAACFGLVAMASGHFHRGLMPVPETLPAKMFFLYAVAIALLVTGAGIFIRSMRYSAAFALGALYFLLFLLIHSLKLAREIGNPNEWTAATEMLQLSAGAFFVARLWLPHSASLQRVLSANKLYLVARIIFGLGMIVFAVLHFKYADFIATLIPDWIPFRYGWTIAIGLGFASAALSCLLNRQLSWAGYTLGIMFLTWALILHLPRVMAKPTEEAEWTSFFVALAMSGASFTLAAVAERLQEERRMTALPMA